MFFSLQTVQNLITSLESELKKGNRDTKRAQKCHISKPMREVTQIEIEGH